MARKSASTPPRSDEALSPRRAAILEVVINEHIDNANPIGSQTVLEHSRLDVSSATVRADMAALETEGYLTQPHTSSGRIPTEKGYRYFVDHLGRGKLAPSKVQQLHDYIGSLQGEITSVYEQTSAVLADVTKYPAFVVQSASNDVSIKDVHLVDFEDCLVLAVVTFSSSEVTRVRVTLDNPVDGATLREASDQLSALLRGHNFADRIELPSRSTPVATLVRRCVEVLWDDAPRVEGDQVFVGGAARVAEHFTTMETARSILDVLDRQLVIVSLIKNLLSSGISVAIGKEHGFDQLASCAVVVAPVTVDGQTAGAVGLLGPTRMKYGEAIAAAEVVSEQLTAKMEAQ